MAHPGAFTVSGATIRQIVFPVVIVTLVAAVVVFASLPSARIAREVAAVNGQITLTPSLAQQPVTLAGEWRMIPAIVDPNASDWSSAASVRVPERQFGIAELTYQLVLSGLSPTVRYSLFMMDVASSGRVFIDGELIGSLGEPRADGSLAPGFVPRVLPLPATGTMRTVTVQVENLLQDGSGIWQTVYFGPSDQIEMLRHRLLAVDTFVIGGVMLLGLYHVLLFLIGGHDRSLAAFGVFALLIGVKTMLSGQQAFLLFATPDQQVFWIRFAYVSVTLAVPVFMDYIHQLYPHEFRPTPLRIVWALSGVQSVVAIIAPFALVQRTWIGWSMIILLAFAYIALGVGRAARHGRSGAVSILAGLFVVFLFTLNDILFDRGVIQTGFFVHAGMFGFVFSQATVIAIRSRLLADAADTLRSELEDKVEERTRELEELARHDVLTGLVNRRFGLEILEHETERFRRYGTPAALVIIDLDHFKQINDERGHLVGDEVLVGFARILTETTRQTDRVCRWGGEEFLLVLPNTTIEDAERLALKLQEALAVMPLETRSGDIALHFSGGVSGTGVGGTIWDGTERDELIDALVQQADTALYSAKRNGRNRIERFVAPPAPEQSERAEA